MLVVIPCGDKHLYYICIQRRKKTNSSYNFNSSAAVTVTPIAIYLQQHYFLTFVRIVFKLKGSEQKQG